MKKFVKKIELYFFIIILLYSCNSVINTLYDDTTARYNAYFIANEVINEIEQELIQTAEYNYDSLINLTYKIDTNRVSGLKEKKDKSIQKLSILIQELLIIFIVNKINLQSLNDK